MKQYTNQTVQIKFKDFNTITIICNIYICTPEGVVCKNQINNIHLLQEYF